MYIRTPCFRRDSYDWNTSVVSFECRDLVNSFSAHAPAQPPAFADTSCRVNGLQYTQARGPCLGETFMQTFYDLNMFD